MVYDMPGRMLEGQVKASQAQTKMLIAYDLALRIEGLHQLPQLTEEQALQVFQRAKALTALLK